MEVGNDTVDKEIGQKGLVSKDEYFMSAMGRPESMEVDI